MGVGACGIWKSPIKIGVIGGLNYYKVLFSRLKRPIGAAHAGIDKGTYSI